MKHLLLLFAFTISFMVNGQEIPPYVQTFDDTTIPAGWSILDNTTPPSGQIWQFGTTGTTVPAANWGTPYDPVLSGNYAVFNSEAYGEIGLKNADLISPTFDLTGIDSVNLQFSHVFNAWESSSATLSYSIDDGTSWTAIKTWTAAYTSNPETFNQVIVGVAGQSAVKFKWNYTEYGWGWAIDNVSVTETTEATWTGAVNTNWHVEGNWDGNAVPGPNSKVIIPTSANNPLIQLDAACYDLTINSGASVYH